MQLVSKYHQRNRFLLCNIDIYNKHALVVPLKKKKKLLQLLRLFKIFLESLDVNQTKYGWIKVVGEFYNR